MNLSISGRCCLMKRVYCTTQNSRVNTHGADTLIPESAYMDLLTRAMQFSDACIHVIKSLEKSQLAGYTIFYFGSIKDLDEQKQRDIDLFYR